MLDALTALGSHASFNDRCVGGLACMLYVLHALGD